MKLFQGQEVEGPFPIDTSVVEETTEDLEETLPTTVFVEVKGAVNAPVSMNYQEIELKTYLILQQYQKCRFTHC